MLCNRSTNRIAFSTSFSHISRKKSPNQVSCSEPQSHVQSTLFCSFILIHSLMIVQSETKVYVHIPRTLTTSIIIVRVTVNCNIPLPSHDQCSNSKRSCSGFLRHVLVAATSPTTSWKDLVRNKLLLLGCLGRKAMLEAPPFAVI